MVGKQRDIYTKGVSGSAARGGHVYEREVGQGMVVGIPLFGSGNYVEASLEVVKGYARNH